MRLQQYIRDQLLEAKHESDEVIPSHSLGWTYIFIFSVFFVIPLFLGFVAANKIAFAIFVAVWYPLTLNLLYSKRDKLQISPFLVYISLSKKTQHLVLHIRNSKKEVEKYVLNLQEIDAFTLSLNSRHFFEATLHTSHKSEASFHFSFTFEEMNHKEGLIKLGQRVASLLEMSWGNRIKDDPLTLSIEFQKGVDPHSLSDPIKVLQEEQNQNNERIDSIVDTQNLGSNLESNSL